MEIENALSMILFEKTLMNANYTEICLIEKVFSSNLREKSRNILSEL